MVGESPEVVEEWVVSGKNKSKSQAQQEPQNAPRERRSSEGTGGRGRTREAVAGGRGAGRSGPRLKAMTVAERRAGALLPPVLLLVMMARNPTESVVNAESLA